MFSFSDGLSTKIMKLQWNDPEVTVSPSVELPQFNMTYHRNFTCDVKYSSGITFGILLLYASI